MTREEHEEYFEKIDNILGKQYESLFIVKKEDILVFKQEIESALEGQDIPERFVNKYIYEKHSLGPLSPLAQQDDLEEIMVIGHKLNVYVYHSTKGMQKTPLVLAEGEIEEIIRRIARYSGRTIDNTRPLLDAMLPDGSRINATMPGVTPKGATITIRKFAKEPLTIVDIINFKTMNFDLAAFLWLVVEGMSVKPANILITGGTASGKTTALNALSSFIPARDRILSIEDVQEISLKHAHWIPMECRPPDSEGHEITMDDLLKNALRMRPSRILVGEVRSEEALTLFTAMNTGHDGCMATIHANSAREGLSRLTSYPMNVPDSMVPALDLIVAMERKLEDGKLVRRIFEVVELAGKEGNVFLTNTLFKYDPRSKELKAPLLNGRIIMDHAKLTGKSISEIDEELLKRKTILQSLAKTDIRAGEVHKVIQLFYKDHDKAIDYIGSRIVR